MNNSKIFDQFYTKENVAEDCLNDFNKIINSLYDYYEFLEPSAGSGSFIKVLEKYGYKYYAYDIDPKYSNIECLNFLDTNIQDRLIGKENLIVIGNPPFGKKGSLSTAFINKSFEYSDTIGFILPLQYHKYSAQKAVRDDAKLIFDKTLDKNSFIFKGKDYEVRCCFQIWTLKETKYKDLRIINKPETSHPDFEMWQYNNTKQAEKYFNKELYQWDFAVPRQGYKDYTLKETNPNNMSRKTQWIFFKAKNEDVLKKLKSIDFTKLSEKNTSTPGFGKADVIEEYKKIY